MNQRIGPKEIEIIAQAIKEGKSAAKVSKMIGFATSTIYSAARANNLGDWAGKKAVRTIPAEFAEYAAVNSNEACAHRFECGVELARKWRAELGVPNYKKPYEERDLAYFAKLAASMPIHKAAKHFGMCSRKARQIRNELGIPKFGSLTTTPVSAGPQTDPEVLQTSVSFLQREGYIPVIRCNPERRPDIAGRFWICGNVHGVLTDAQLIERVTEIRERRERMMNRKAA